jgi:biopolymer transport protein ExbB
VIALLGHVRDLWSEGGVVMPALFCSAFILWVNLGRRMMMLRRGVGGPLRGLVTRALNGQLRGNPSGIIGEAVVRGAALWREHQGPVPERKLDEAFGDLEDRLHSGITLSRVLVGMAPLLGLLGTVTGLIETFGSLGTSSTSAASEGIAGGIVEALYATQMGLAIAVPGLLTDGVLHHRGERLTLELDELREILAGAMLKKKAA